MTACYIVVGPESSGNRYVTRLLVSAGCNGHGSTSQPLVDCDATWRVSITPSNSPLAFVRSYPHGDTADNWPDLSAIIGAARQARFEPTVLVCIRNQYSTQQSQVRVGHAATEAEADSAIQSAHKSIVQALASLEVDWLFVGYEALGLPDYRRWLMRRLGLDETSPLEPFLSGNTQYS